MNAGQQVAQAQVQHRSGARRGCGNVVDVRAYSNHIRATAAAGHYFGFDTIGVIRGEEHLPLNDVLAYATGRGMTLTYLDRETYRHKDRPEVVDVLRSRWGEFYLVPEGGSNTPAVLGCRELIDEIDVDFEAICCPCGTGGTLAGVSAGLRDGQRAVGFSVLKGGAFLTDDVASLQQAALGSVVDNWRIETEFHFGGFARRTPQLDEFILEFESATDVRGLGVCSQDEFESTNARRRRDAWVADQEQQCRVIPGSFTPPWRSDGCRARPGATSRGLRSLRTN